MYVIFSLRHLFSTSSFLYVTFLLNNGGISAHIEYFLEERDVVGRPVAVAENGRDVTAEDETRDLFDDPQSVVLHTIADFDLAHIQNHVLVVVRSGVKLADDVEPLASVCRQMVSHTHSLPR